MKFEQIIKIKTDGVYEADTKYYHIVMMTKHITATVLNITIEQYYIGEERPISIKTVTPNTILNAPYFAELRQADWDFIC